MVVPVLLLLQLLLLLLLAGEEVEEEEEEDDDMVMDEPRENRLRPPLSGFCGKRGTVRRRRRFSRRSSSVLIIGRAMTMTRSVRKCREYKIKGYIFSDPKLESWGGKGATIKEARMFQLARNG